MMLSRYCKIYPSVEDPDSVVLFSTKKSSSVLLPAVMLKDLETGKISEDERETLCELGFLVRDHGTETEEVSGLIAELNGLNTTFHAKPVMNLDCNLECRYCFEGQRKGKFYMRKETADLFIGFVNERVSSETFEEISITFYGGEPLLSPELIFYMAKELKSLAEEKGIRFSFSFITNGTLLTGKTVEKLMPLGLKSAAITIDGPREIHDYFRPFRGGAGSFDLILKNVKAVCDMVDVQIGGNFTRDNYREYPMLLDFMQASGLTPDKISLVRFDPVLNEREGVANPDFHDGCVSLSEPWLFEAMVFLREEILKRGYGSEKIMPATCMMEYTHSIVINHEGSIYKCPGLIGREEHCAGHLSTGTRDYQRSYNLDSWRNGECLNCCYLPLCFGGCRYMKLIRHGNMDGVDCRKPYLDATLEALVKQDIRYGLIKK